MSTHTRPTARPQGPPEPTSDPIERPAGRTIVASVAAGALAALLLALVVFPGGTEATITGALMLGFGIGWAVIAALTVRRTCQPQTWALVPALAMGTTGIALVVFSPGDATLTALNWVWPPLMMALTAWMLVHVRRSATGRARWVLVAVMGVLVLASVGATYDNLARADQATVAAPGTLYEVDGRRLHLDCRGVGSPTVVLFNGLGGVSASWARVTSPVAATTRVCAYDRAGQGWSDEASTPRDGVESAEDLHTVLAMAGEHGPYVLTGHSTGGTYAMTFAARYPEEVAGLVLLDSSSPEQFTRMPAYPNLYNLVLRRGFALLPTLSRLGLGQLPASSPLPAADAAKVTAITSTPQYFRNQRDEISVIPELFAQAQALTTLDGRPLVVLTASETSNSTDGWVGAQGQLAALSTDSVQRTIESTHAGMIHDVRPAREAVLAITEVISSVRAGTRLPSS